MDAPVLEQLQKARESDRPWWKTLRALTTYVGLSTRALVEALAEADECEESDLRQTYKEYVDLVVRAAMVPAAPTEGCWHTMNLAVKVASTYAGTGVESRAKKCVYDITREVRELQLTLYLLSQTGTWFSVTLKAAEGILGVKEGLAAQEFYKEELCAGRYEDRPVPVQKMTDTTFMAIDMYIAGEITELVFGKPSS